MADYVSDVTILLQNLRRFAFGSAHEDIADTLQRLPGTDADVICSAAEVLYTHYDLLDAAGKTVCAELFNYAEQNRWTGFNREDRSRLIVEHIEVDLAGFAAPSADWPAPEANRRSDGADWRGPIASAEAPPVVPEAQ